jgi:class 3 adenylate cyclase
LHETDKYFQLIVDKTFEFVGSDIMKYAGDAIFVNWRATSDMPIQHCVLAAAQCAASLVRECADFPVYANVNGVSQQDSPIAHLNIHCGLAHGKMTGFHVGDDRSRREYLYIGEPIQQATQMCNQAKLGEVMASSGFYDVLLAHHAIRRDNFDYNNNAAMLIATRDISRLVLTRDKVVRAAHNAKSRWVRERSGRTRP